MKNAEDGGPIVAPRATVCALAPTPRRPIDPPNPMQHYSILYQNRNGDRNGRSWQLGSSRQLAPRRKKYMWIMPRLGATNPRLLRRGAPPRCLAPVAGTKGGGLVAILDLT